MTTPSTERKAGPLLGTGAQTAWPFTFKVFAATDIAVTIANSLGVETALVYGVDYSVTLNANQETSPGGTVTYPISGTPLPTGSRLVILGNLPYDQPLDLPAGGNFSPLALENELDRLTMQIQQLRERIGRALQVSVTTGANVGLPAPSANELIGWDSTGQTLQNFGLSELSTAVAYATMRYDTFTGDGVDTQFTLTADPVTLANLDVAISGVTQVPGTDYSLVSGVLVFTSAPANGTQILARYGEGLVNVGGDSSDIRFLQAGTNAEERTVEGKLRDVVSVKDFGAVGDGATDDTAAIQAAINYCQDNIKALYFPSNNVSAYYKTTAPLVVSKPLAMFGDSSRNVTILAVGLTAGQYVLDIDGTAFGTFEQGVFGGFTLFAGSGDCMRIKDVSNSVFSDIGLRNCVRGIIYTGTRCYSNRFEKIFTVTGMSGECFLVSAHTGGGQHSFYDCSFGGTTGFSIATNCNIDSVNFYNSNFEQCTVNSFYVGGTVAGLGFYGCRTEGCDSTDFQINPVSGKTVTGLVVEGCSFNSSDAGGVPRISIGGASGKVRGFNINANSVGHGANNFSSYLVNLNGDGESGTIANNWLDGQKALCAPTNVRRANVAIYNNEANDGKFDPGFVLADGTWTPTDASGAGLTFSTAAGTYTKVGRLVFWQVVLVYPVTANGSNAKFTLPSGLAPEGGSGSQGRSGAGAPTTDSAVVSALQLADGVVLYKSGMVAATNADMSGKQIYIGGTYYTTGV